MKTVGIIGGSGFIGSYITKKFLNEGYHVKTSVTDIQKSDKYQHLFDLKNSDNLNICPLKVENLAVLKEFISDCEIVVHGGTPFQLDFVDAKKELFDPTIKGTENFLKAVSEAPAIKKVILIASVAAWNTNFPLPVDGKDVFDSFSETDTPFMSEESHPYAQAKFIANETVTDFIKKHPDLKFEISSVSPVMVMGKSLSNREDSTSTGLQFLIKDKIAPNPFIQMFYDEDVWFTVVDVADVAEGVYRSAITSGIHAQNYILSSESYPVSDISLMLNKKSPKNSARIIYENLLAEKELGCTFRPVKETLKQYSA